MNDQLEQIQHDIDDLAGLPPDETARGWMRVKAQVDMICAHLVKSDAATAQETLPALADLIQTLDQVIQTIEDKDQNG